MSYSGNFIIGRPNVSQEDILSILANSNWLLLEVNVHLQTKPPIRMEPTMPTTHLMI
jgi:hypothetical protein